MTYGVPGTAKSHLPFVSPGRPHVGTVSRRQVTSAIRNTKLLAAAGSNLALIAHIISRSLRVSAFQRNFIARATSPCGLPHWSSAQTLLRPPHRSRIDHGCLHRARPWQSFAATNAHRGSVDRATAAKPRRPLTDNRRTGHSDAVRLSSIT